MSESKKSGKPKHAASRQQPRRALITGVTGQDGSYLAELLLDKGYEVVGVVRRTSHDSYERIGHLLGRLQIVPADLLDQHSLTSVIRDARPHEVYNLAAQSFVPTSWSQPVLTGEFTALGVTRLLEAVRLAHPEARVYQASSSEMFGKAVETPQRESTPFHPRSPYGVAKVYAHHLTVNYRESYGLFACAGIMFNHESSRRGEEFVTRKVTRAVAAIAAGRQDGLTLGRLDPRRDWGWAPEYMAALPLIAARDEPGDYVLATGITRSVADWCEAAFAVAGLDWRDRTRSDPALYRPAEVEYLRGDAGKAKRELGWEARVPFGEIVRRMTEHDLMTEAQR